MKTKKFFFCFIALENKSIVFSVSFKSKVSFKSNVVKDCKLYTNYHRSHILLALFKIIEKYAILLKNA